MRVIFILLLFYALVPFAGCNRGLEIYENLRKNVNKECQQTDERKGEIPLSTKQCAPTGDFSLLCLPSGRIGEAFMLNCSIDKPESNETSFGLMERICSPDGKWIAMDELNPCKFMTLNRLNEEFYRLGIDPFLDLSEYEFNEVLEHLGKFENEETYVAQPGPDGQTEVISQQDSERIRLLDLILGSISCFFSILGLFMLLWLYPQKKHDRVNVHRHLFGVLFLSYLTQIIFFEYGRNRKIFSLTSCHVSYFLYAYFTVMVYMWLFNEGLYHFWIIFFPYKDALKFRYFVLVGYGLATLELAIYIPGVLLDEKTFFLCKADSGGVFSMVTKWDKILWYSSSALLFLNIFIFIYLMVILRKKLQREKGSSARKSWRLVRSWFILLILLGGGHFFAVESSYAAKYVALNYFQTIVLGLQGFLIFVSQVLFSSDVKKKIRSKWRIYLQKKEFSNTPTLSTPMSIRAATSSLKLSVYKINSINTLKKKGSYSVNSVKKTKQEQQHNEVIDNNKNKNQELQPVPSNSQTEAENGGMNDVMKKQTVAKQNSLGFDNVGFHKEEH